MRSLMEKLAAWLTTLLWAPRCSTCGRRSRTVESEWPMCCRPHLRMLALGYEVIPLSWPTQITWPACGRCGHLKTEEARIKPAMVE